MELRTPIPIPRHKPLEIKHGEGIVMLGSCFTDNIGEKLRMGGFNVVHNPLGTLYNPASILNALQLAMSGDPCPLLHTVADAKDEWHCLDFAARYIYPTLADLQADLCTQLQELSQSLNSCRTLIITLGTSYVFSTADGRIVGNCHKLPSSTFTRTRLSIEECKRLILQIIDTAGADKDVIFTVSPVRHTADGLHGNQLSKATLLIALDQALAERERAFYFPAYEIMMDDLRDYRFYADDLKHPSSLAVQYIYERFMDYYMTPATASQAATCKKEYLRTCHRPILTSKP